MAVTIKDVANRAGVSIGTVSNVLNGKPGEFRQETYDRVMRAIRELNYYPNRIAKSLVQRESHAIGLSFVDQSQSLRGNPYIADILDGMAQAGREEGYNISLYTRLQLGQEEQHISAFLDRSIDALCIAAPDRDNAQLPLLAETALPFLVVGVEEPLPGVSWIDVDNREGTRLAMECLFAHGHTRIAHLAGEVTQKAAWRRAEAYLRAMRERGLTPQPGWLFWAGFDEEDAHVPAYDLLSSPDRPTAIFCANDQVAIGTLAIARQLGLRVPEDLSILGFDDIREAEFVSPALTTIRQPTYEIGYRATRWLIAVLRGETRPPLAEYVSPTLMMRETVGPAPQISE